MSYEISIIILPLLIIFDILSQKLKLQKLNNFNYLPFAVLTFFTQLLGF